MMYVLVAREGAGGVGSFEMEGKHPPFGLGTLYKLIRAYLLDRGVITARPLLISESLLDDNKGE